MRIGLLADIHANARALRVVLAAASRLHVDTLLVAGDLVGYYFEPRVALQLLKTWRKYMVRGNHEEMLMRSLGNAEYLAEVTSKYGSGIEVAIDELSSLDRDLLCNLPRSLSLEFDSRKIFLCHGSPHDIDSYIYPDSSLSSMEDGMLAEMDLIVAGHTHYPMLRETSSGSLVVNPGSVGQPRNRAPGAQWALYDTATGAVSLFCEDYDYTIVQAEAKARHPALPYLSEVLGRR